MRPPFIMYHCKFLSGCVPSEFLLLLHHCPTVHELVNATSSVDELSLTSVEWVRS